MGLMEETNLYGDLVRRYGQFRTPACRLRVDGKELSGVGVEQISATLSLEGASAVSFSVAGAYRPKESGFDSSMKSRLMLGAKVSLSLGYGSAVTEVFQGYISSVGAQFDGSPVLTVTAMDMRRLMMEGTSREVTHVVTSCSAAFQKVMQRYRPLFRTMAVDATNEKEMTQIVQRTSDYDFIRSALCQKADREFFVLADTVYFREPKKNTAPITTLRWGEGLMSFSRSSMYQNSKITVIGFDPEKMDTVEAAVTEKAGAPQKSVVAQDQTSIPDPDAKAVEKAKKRAQKEAEEREKKSRSGSGVCVGLPEIVPGRFLKLTGLDSDLNTSYYIREVRHEFGSDGFTTSFEIGGWL